MHISAVGQAIVEKVVLGIDSNSTYNPNTTNLNSEWTTRISMGAMNTSFLAGVKNDRPKTNGPNNIQTLNYAYGAKRAKLLAVFPTQMPYDTANNAENYALYALARYVMKTQGFYPIKPTLKYSSEMALLSDKDMLDGDDKQNACLQKSDVV
jgi:hypothetical protein